jgi:exodeoxyribonuclease VII large subunit
LLRDRAQLLDQLTERLTNAMHAALNQQQHRLNIASEKLNLLNPWGVLQRGYSVVRRQDGSVVSSATSVETGESLDVWLHKGKLTVNVTATEKVRDS